MNYRLIILFGTLYLPVTLLGHHSVAGTFDLAKIVETEGEVTDVIWRNPHVRFTVSAPDNSLWNIEMTSLSSLRRRGITEQLIASGDRIKVAGNPDKASGTGIYARNLLLADDVEIWLGGGGSEPRWSEETVGRGNPRAEGDSSAPELGIYRVWSTPIGAGLLFPEDTDANFDFDRYPLTAAARASVEAFDPATDSPILNCVSKGMPTIMEQPYPMRFLRQGNDIVLHTEEYDTLRMIDMDPAASAEGQPTSKLGYSIGRWEGDTLVVTTIGVDWPNFDVVGIPQSEQSVIVERFTLAADGSRLDYTLAVTDPVNFTEPVMLEKHWLYHPEVTVEPFQCAR